MDMPPATPTLGSLLKRIDALEIENVALKAALERLKGENETFKSENEAFKGENVVLKAKVERLTLELAAAKKNSRNSSKPLSARSLLRTHSTNPRCSTRRL